MRVTDVDAELLKRMRASGCRLICFGLESADDAILKSMRKGIRVDQIKRALDLSYEAGISTEASNFIFGDVNETVETVANTLKVWWEYNHKTHINLGLIHIYPGTYLYEDACNRGIITDREQFLRDGCPVVNVSKLSRSEFQDLRSLLSELRLHPHVPAESVRIKDWLKNGQCQIEYRCRKCKALNLADADFWFTQTCHCLSCGVKNEVDPFRGVLALPEAFGESLPRNRPIAMWGAGGIYYKLVWTYRELASERFFLVDSNVEHHGLRICQKAIHPPEAIRRRKTDTVIITALSRKDEILATLGRKFPLVKNVFVPDVKRQNNGVVPILALLPASRPVTRKAAAGTLCGTGRIQMV